jgi:Asp/Glu/hydantoin racemase
VPGLVGAFNSLAQEILPPGVELLHTADELLLKAVLAQGGLSPFIYRRVSDHVVAAEQAGAGAVMFTCSSISPCADVARWLVGIPVLKIDEPMVDQAISLGSRIGVVATAPTALKPTTDLVRARAEKAGQQVEVEAVLCSDAYTAIMAGDVATHDQLVGEVIKELMARNQVIVLAQASMARVIETIPAAEQSAPILTSPRLALKRAGDVIQATA